MCSFFGLVVFSVVLGLCGECLCLFLCFGLLIIMFGMEVFVTLFVQGVAG